MAVYKRAFAYLAATVLLLALLLSRAFAAGQIAMVTAKHYNVMFVLDGSGSLGSTDPSGFRFQAVSAFLDPMTDSGNYGGAIVFDDKKPLPLDREILPISSFQKKRELFTDIRNAKAGEDTDIGSALLTAAEELSKVQNATRLPSVIVLMSDGVMDLPDRAGSSREDRERVSQESTERAIKLCQENQIRIYSVLLDHKGQLHTDEGLKAFADKAHLSVEEVKKRVEEVESLSEKTDGKFECVENAEDLLRVLDMYYELIYLNEYTPPEKYKFDESGTLTIPLNIPDFGVEELNVTTLLPGGVNSLQITDQDHTPISEEMLLRGIYETNGYAFRKMLEPPKGQYYVEIQGEPNQEVQVKLVTNTDLQLELRAEEGKLTYESGKPISVLASLKENGKPVTNPNAYREEHLSVTMVQGANVLPVEVKSEGNQFRIEVTAPEVSQTADYVMQAVFQMDRVRVTSNSLKVIINPRSENHPPMPIDSILEHEVQNSGDGYDYLPLEGLFRDADGDKLTYTIDPDEYSVEEVSLSGDRIKIKASVRNGAFRLQASDGEAIGVMILQLLGNAPPEPVDAPKKLTVEIHKPKILGGKEQVVFPVEEWFRDPDGDPLHYTIGSSDYKDGTISLSPENELVIQTEGLQKNNVLLWAEDPAGNRGELTVRIGVFDWWLAYGIFVIVIVLLVVVSLIVYFITRPWFKGYILVNNIGSSGFFDSSGEGFRTSHPSQRRPLTLKSLYGINIDGFDGRSKIVPVSSKKIRFQSKKNFYYNGRAVKKVEISMDSSVDVYPTSEKDHGLRISTRSKDSFGGDKGRNAHSISGNSSWNW